MVTLRGYVICSSWQKWAVSVAFGGLFLPLKNDWHLKETVVRAKFHLYLYIGNTLNEKFYNISISLKDKHAFYLILFLTLKHVYNILTHSSTTTMPVVSSMGKAVQPNSEGRGPWEQTTGVQIVLSTSAQSYGCRSVNQSHFWVGIYFHVNEDDCNKHLQS